MLVLLVSLMKTVLRAVNCVYFDLKLYVFADKCIEMGLDYGLGMDYFTYYYYSQSEN